MRKLHLISATALAISMAMPAFAQDAPQADDEGASGDEIVVTAQRTSQRLQDVPIAVSAFSAEALDKQQIENTSDLQLTLPNVTFTKTNFTSSSFTIRGIGDLCVGVSCDQATAIHMNDAPLFSTGLFEGEFFDIGQIEVLRGPQGTLFGRNATSGVVNIKTARPQMGTFGAAGEAEYGNFDSMKVKGMVNVPIGDMIGARVAGYYLKRDGYTKNLFDGNRIDDREMYSIRGSLRFEPTDTTTIDLVGQYFHERDNRLRIQKQQCQRDPTGVMGCLNGTREFGTTNANTTFTGVLTSREFFALRGLPTALALGSLYGTDINAGVVNPADVRVVNSDFTPQYFTDELILQGSLEQELGGGLNLSLSGNYQEVEVDSSQDYNLSVANRAVYAGALNTLAFFAANGIPTGIASPAFVPGSAAYFAPIAAAIMPNGPNGALCTSLPEDSGTGSFGGNKLCGNTPLDFDRSNQKNQKLVGRSDY
jgi:iron complex outermembrane receptor protein